MEQNVNKKDFINLIAAKLDQVSVKHKFSKKDVEIFVEQFLECCSESLKKGKRVFFAGFGALSVRERKATIKANPKNPNQKVNVPSRKTVRFKPSDKLNDSLN